jgi:hypothetical protein
MSKQSTITAKVPRGTARKIREYAKKNGVTVASLYGRGIEELAMSLESKPAQKKP